MLNKANVGSTDRALRALIGVVLLATALFIATPWNWIAAAAGVVLILTATLRFCPAYALIGASTCPVRRTIA